MFPIAGNSELIGLRRDLNHIEQSVEQSTSLVSGPESLDDACEVMTQLQERWSNDLGVGFTSDNPHGASLEEYLSSPISFSENSPLSIPTTAALRPFTTEYVSTRGLTGRHFQTAMHPTFTSGETILKPRLTDEGTGTKEWIIGQIGVWQDATLWSTGEREPPFSNTQARWSCSVVLDEDRLGGRLCLDGRDSLRVQCITRNESDPFVPVQHRNATGTLLDKMRQTFLHEIGAQTSSSRVTKLPSSLINFDRPIEKHLGFQGYLIAEEREVRSKNRETIPLTVNVSLSFSPDKPLSQYCPSY